MPDAFPLVLLAVLVLVILLATPWRRPHPNHQFILELLRSQLKDEQENLHDSRS